MKKRIGYLEQPDKFADITVPPAMLAEFKVMVSRAMSTWQDVSPDMRDFADRVLGREHVVGSNMKEGFQKDITPEEARTIVKQLATRSCCGTMLREPHLASCAELAKLYKHVNMTIRPPLIIIDDTIPPNEIHAVLDERVIGKVINIGPDDVKVKCTCKESDYLVCSKLCTRVK